MSALTPEEQEKLPSSPRAWSVARLAGVGLTLLVLAAAVIFGYDEKLQPADDLLPRRPVPRLENNGWVLLQELWGEELESLRKNRQRWYEVIEGESPWNEKLAGELLAGSETLQADAEKALALPDWQWPERLQATKDGRVPGLEIVYRFPSWQAQILSDWKRGNFPAVLTGLQTMNRLCRRNIAGSTTFGCGLISIVTFNMVLKPVPWMIANPGTAQPDDAFWAALQGMFLEPVVNGEDLEEMMRGELLLDHVTADMRAQAERSSPLNRVPGWLKNLLYKKNQTANHAADILRRRTEAGAWLNLEPTAGAHEWYIFGENSSSRSALGSLMHPNAWGKAELNWWLQHIASLEVYARQRIASARLMAVRIALHRWQLRHGGSFPDDAAQLVPEFMRELPVDPWSGEALKLDARKEMVYAIGVDGLDDLPLLFFQTWIYDGVEQPAIRFTRVPLPPPVPFRR